MIKVSDGFRVEQPISLSEYHQDALFVCYQPIVGPLAINLYLTLIREGRVSLEFQTHHRLFQILDCHVDQFLKARQLLESVQLLRTHSKKQENRIYYVYSLQIPLVIFEFLNHDVMGRILTQRVGKEFSVQTQLRYSVEKLHLQSFTEISASTKDLLKQWDEMKEAEFQHQKSSNAAIEPTLSITFDTAKFLRLFTTFNFPIAERTPVNIQMIEKGAALYGIGEEEMRALVIKSIDIDTNKLNAKTLSKLMSSYQNKEIIVTEDPFDMNPIHFLQSKQPDIPVAEADKNLIIGLQEKFKLKPEVVNVLVNHVLQSNNQNLNKSYIEKIATNWHRLNIDSKQAAIEATQNPSFNKGALKPDAIPEWYHENESESQAQLDKEQRLEIINKIKRKGQKP